MAFRDLIYEVFKIKVMQQISQNLYVLTPQDQWDGSLDGCIKIFLSGSVDLGKPVGWQEKFINGLTKLSDPVSGDERFKSKSFCVLNPKMAVNNPSPTLDNQEFCNKIHWEHQMMSLADIVFCNFMKKSQAPSAIYGLLLNAQAQGKTIVRCPLEYSRYPLVKLVTESYQIPLLGDTGSVVDVMNLAFERCEKFQVNTEFGLGE
jgi:hypothetical protein